MWRRQWNSGGAPQHCPPSPNSTVSAVETFRFLGSEPGATYNTDWISKEAEQRMCFLLQLKKFNLPLKLLICLHFARPSLYGLDQLPNRTRTNYNGQWGLQDLNKSRIDTHNLFTLLPSRRRYRARTSKQADICSFFPKAVTLINTLSLYSNIQHSCCIIHILYSCFIIYWLLSTAPWSTFLVKGQVGLTEDVSELQ